MTTILLMDIPIYENKIPIIDEHVLVIFTEYKSTHIEAELLEYNSINGLMIYEDATRKKKIYDWKKEIPLNKITVARVEEIFSNDYIKLSTGYFNNRLDTVELKKELMKPFLENKILLNIIKKICKNNNLDFNIFWSEIIYKINNEKKNENINKSILEFISENIELFTNLIKKKYENDYEKIIDEYNKLINHNISKIQSKFSLIANKSIENTKELLKLVCDNNTEWIFTLKYENTPTFILESSIDNSTLENHKKFLTFLEEKSNLYNVIYSE